MVCRKCHEHVEEPAGSNNKKECMQPRDNDMMKIGAVIIFIIAQVALARVHASRRSIDIANTVD